MRRRRRYRAARFQTTIRHAGLPRGALKRERTRVSSAAAARVPSLPIAPELQTRAEKRASSQYADAHRDESSRRPPPAASAEPPKAGRCRARAGARAGARKSRLPARRTTKPLHSVGKPGAEALAPGRTTIPRQTRADPAWWTKTDRCAEPRASPESARRFGCAIRYPSLRAADSIAAPPAATRKEK